MRRWLIEPVFAMVLIALYAVGWWIVSVALLAIVLVADYDPWLARRGRRGEHYGTLPPEKYRKNPTDWE